MEFDSTTTYRHEPLRGSRDDILRAVGNMVHGTSTCRVWSMSAGGSSADAPAHLTRAGRRIGPTQPARAWGVCGRAPPWNLIPRRRTGTHLCWVPVTPFLRANGQDGAGKVNVTAVVYVGESSGEALSVRCREGPRRIAPILPAHAWGMQSSAAVESNSTAQSRESPPRGLGVCSHLTTIPEICCKILHSCPGRNRLGAT